MLLHSTTGTLLLTHLVLKNSRYRDDFKQIELDDAQFVPNNTLQPSKKPWPITIGKMPVIPLLLWRLVSYIELTNTVWKAFLLAVVKSSASNLIEEQESRKKLNLTLSRFLRLCVCSNLICEWRMLGCVLIDSFNAKINKIGLVILSCCFMGL